MEETAEAPVQETTQPLSVDAFAAKIKEKYPQYKDIDNTELTKKIVEKYPEYKDKVSLQPQTVDKPIPLDDPYDVAAKERVKNEPKPLPKALGDWVDILSAPAKNFHDNLESGAKDIKSGVKDFGKFSLKSDVTGSLKVLKGVGEGVFGIGSATPIGAAISSGFEAAHKGVEALPPYIISPVVPGGIVEPAKVLEFISAPITTSINEVDPDYLKKHPTVELASSVADMAVPLALGALAAKGKGALADKIREGEPMKSEDVQDAVNTLHSVTQGEYQQVAKQIVVDHLHDDIAPIAEKGINLHQDKNAAAQVLGKPAADAIFDPKIQEEEQKFEQQSQNLTVKSSLEKAREVLPNEDGKKVVDEQLNKVKENIKQLNPESNAIQKPSTESVDVRQPTADGETLGKGNAEKEKTSQEEEKVAGKETPLDEAKRIADNHGYDHPAKMLNSIKKNTGASFDTVQEAVKSDKPEVQEFLSSRETPKEKPAAEKPSLEQRIDQQNEIKEKTNIEPLPKGAEKKFYYYDAETGEFIEDKKAKPFSNRHGLDLFKSTGEDGKVTINDTKTGVRVAEGKDLAEAQNNLDAKIEKNGIDKFQQKIGELAKQTGDSPRIKAQKLADFIRKGKIGDDIAMASVPFAKEVYNGALEVLAKAIEAGGEIGEAIKSAIEYIKDTDWYKGLSTDDKLAAETKFTEDAENTRFNPNKGKEITKEEIQAIIDSKPSKSYFERLKEGLKESRLGKIGKSIVTTFDPFVGGTKSTPSIYNDARLTSITLREKLGEMQRNNELSAKDSMKRTLFFDRLSKADQISFIANLERGIKSGDAKLDALADSYKERLNKVFDTIKSIKDIPYIEDYFPHFWKDPDGARRVFSKKPLEGSKSFLKQRFYSDIIEGMKNGLELVSSNPEDLTRLAEINANKFKMANDFFEALKEKELVKYFKHGDQPEGWSLVDDPLFKRTSLFTKVTEEGDVESAMKMGGYYMPSEAAELVKRYTSRGLQGDVANTIKQWNGLLNQFQLGISLFHGLTTTIDAAVGSDAIGLDKLSRGDIKGGLKYLAKGTTLIPNVIDVTRVGGKAIKDFQSGVINDDVRMMMVANARTGMDAIYRSNMLDSFRRSFAKGEIGNSLWKAIPAAIDLAAKPIFEKFVPRLKVGSFLQLAKNEIGKLENPTQEQVNRTIQKSWDDIENRLGQMTYDNLFWDKVTKDIGFLTVRSLGWNLGTVRAFGGGVRDIPLSAKSFVKGKGISPRTAWTVSLVGQTALMGAIFTYLSTGQSPQNWKDYFYPRTGEKDKDGNDDRIQFPTYMKEVFNTYQRGIGETFVSKASPLGNQIGEIMQNKDFYGEQIYDPLDPANKRGLDILKYIGEQAKPFAFRKPPASIQTKAGEMRRFIGLQPAPRTIVSGKDKSAIYKKIQAADADIKDLRLKLRRKDISVEDFTRKYTEVRNKKAQFEKDLYGSGSNPAAPVPAKEKKQTRGMNIRELIKKP